MNGVQVIQESLGSTQFLFNKYLEDLSDTDFLVRPVPGANHLAWQIGHLIHSEIMLVRSQVSDAKYPDLPADWADVHSPKTAGNEGPGGFRSKAEYLSIFNEVRGSTIANVGKLTDADLDRPTQGRFTEFAPKLGNMLLMVVNHTLMHAGQFSVVRRKLGKPVIF